MKEKPNLSVYAVITVDTDLVAAPGAGNALGIHAFFMECTVAEASKVSYLKDGDGVIIGELSLETVGNSIKMTYGTNYPLILTENKKLHIDTTGTGTGATAYSVIVTNELA